MLLVPPVHVGAVAHEEDDRVDGCAELLFAKRLELANRNQQRCEAFLQGVIAGDHGRVGIRTGGEKLRQAIDVTCLNRIDKLI
jgi:hypothetical protein